MLQQLLDLGVVSGLSDDLQWTIRMLVPREGPADKSCLQLSAAPTPPAPPRFSSVGPPSGAIGWLPTVDLISQVTCVPRTSMSSPPMVQAINSVDL